jgi:hypothetical protein
MSLVETVVAICCRQARAVVVLCLLVAAAAGVYAVNHFGINTDSESLISSDLPWRKQEVRFDRLFPQRNNLVLVVVDGATAELAQSAADALADKLAADPAKFPAVRRPDGGEFFARHGLLYLSEDEVQKTMGHLVDAQPFLSNLAADPSLRGVMSSLDTALIGIQHGQAKLVDVEPPINAFANTLDKVERGQNAFLSWRTLFTGSTGGERTRSFIEVQPRLNYAALSPGRDATDAIRQTARALGLTPDKGVRVRLTGPVPMADDDFSTLADRADVMALATFCAVTLMLWLAVRSFRIILCILLTLFSGLIITTGVGLWAVKLFTGVGVFNIISIAFIALFVGLGVDFAIQFAVRYRSERHKDGDLKRALAKAGRRAGVPLALAAAATAAGFLSFLPTNYVGVAELGLVAGIGMIVAFTLAITFLPALLYLMKPPGEAERVGFRFLAPLDRFLAKHRSFVLRLGALAGLLALCSVPFLKFDFNPLDLRNRHVESVSTLYDLMQDPDTSPYTIDVLAPSLADADKLADKLQKNPLIGQVLTLDSFVPDDQPKKLAMISDTSFLLDTALNPLIVKPSPSDAETVASLKQVVKGLRKAAGKSTSEPAERARKLASTLAVLADGPSSLRQAASAALIPGLQKLLDELRQALEADQVSISTMPKEMVEEWVAKDGTARLQVFPKNNVKDNKSLKRFSKAVLAVTDQATGAPIGIQEAGETIVTAFIQAGAWSFLAIMLLLMLVLHRVQDVALTVAPLILTALLTLATCRLAGLQLNYANIIALPLLLGIGVAFNIYFVVAWRAGTQALLQSSLTRAVIFSALTTASGFGSLWLSSHPGTASMGELLIISLGWTLFTTLFYLPALLGPPPKKA